MPLIWPKDSIKSREAQMFNSTGFPLFKYTNTITDVDPKWTDPTIYKHEDSLILWTFPASVVHAMGYPSTSEPPAISWPQWHWYPSGSPSLNTVWPVFDGTYKNGQILRGSIEGLPLGDLNWYPAAKAVWEANKDSVMRYVKRGQTAQLNFGYTEMGIKNPSANFSVSLYPNPTSNVLNVAGAGLYTITITSLDGRTLKYLQNVQSVNVSDISDGLYLVTLKQGNSSSTQKVIIKR